MTKEDRALFDSAATWLQRHYPGYHLRSVALVLDDGQVVHLPAPRPTLGPVGETVAEAAARHSPDFRSVNWFGVKYSFTESQAEAVRLLWDNWEAGTPEVGDKLILKAAGSVSIRLADVFRDHECRESLIVEGQTRGTHALAEPGCVTESEARHSEDFRSVAVGENTYVFSPTQAARCIRPGGRSS